MPALGLRDQGQAHLSLRGGDETFEAGDAYYAPPGHTPYLFAGTEIVEFSPTDALQETVAVVVGNLRAAGVEV